jgi:hypothetical protein
VIRISSWPFVLKKLHLSDRQDYVFIRQPGISDGAFQLRMNNTWFFKLLLLFSIDTMTDAGMKMNECAYVSVLEEYKGRQRPGYIVHILYIVHTLHVLFMILFDCCAARLDACQSTLVYERRESAQVLYVIPVSSILGRLPLVPVGNTGTIPYEMRREAADFSGASCHKTKVGKDGCRWWYVNSWALSWGINQLWNEDSPRDL